MTVTLNSLARWAVLAADEAVVFEGLDEAERRVRLNLNLEAVTTLFIGYPDGSENLLVTVGPGLETVVFNVAGSFKVYAENGSGIVHYQSADLEPNYVEVVDPKIFTKIAQRRHRNPELEEMMYRMQANMERRLAAQTDEIEALYARQLQEAKNAATVQANPPAVAPTAGASEVPAQVPAGEKPGESAGTPAGSEQPSNGGGTPA
jgi:hypothetical protein